MKRPEEMTQQAFCKLVVNECEARGWTKASAAAHCRIATGSMIAVGRGEFPGNCRGDKRRERPRIQTVMRICTTLGLDTEACLKACDLDPGIIPARELLVRTKPVLPLATVVDREDVEVLKKSIDLLGPIPVTTALELLSLARAKRAEAT